MAARRLRVQEGPAARPQVIVAGELEYKDPQKTNEEEKADGQGDRQDTLGPPLRQEGGGLLDQAYH